MYIVYRIMKSIICSADVVFIRDSVPKLKKGKRKYYFEQFCLRDFNIKYISYFNIHYIYDISEL